MTEKNSSVQPETEGNDHSAYDFRYDHGRMPMFMKIVWVGFIILTTYYIVANLLPAVGVELGG